MDRYFTKNLGADYKGLYQFVDLDTAYRDLSRYEREGMEDLADEVYTILRNLEDPFGIMVYRTRRFCKWIKVKNRVVELLGEDSQFANEKHIAEVLYQHTNEVHVFHDMFRIDRDTLKLIVQIIKGRKIMYNNDELRDRFEQEYKRALKFRKEKEKLEKANKELEARLKREETLKKLEAFEKDKADMTEEQMLERAKDLNEAFAFLVEKGVPTAIIKEWFNEGKIDIGDLESVKAQYQRLIDILDRVGVDESNELFDFKMAERLARLEDYRNSEEHQQEEAIREFIWSNIDVYSEKQDEMASVVSRLFDKSFKFSITRAHTRSNGRFVDAYVRVLFN